jgi:uncharacterized protein YdhG (YjbR/CyaY superfamily)
LSIRRKPPQDIDEYIAGFPPDVRKVLKKIRATIRKAAPDAEETIKYGMPTFTLNGNLVHFAAFKKHIGLFPPIKGAKELKMEASRFDGPKGNLRFPLEEPIPYSLIGKIVKLRARESIESARTR